MSAFWLAGTALVCLGASVTSSDAIKSPSPRSTSDQRYLDFMESLRTMERVLSAIVTNTQRQADYFAEFLKTKADSSPLSALQSECDAALKEVKNLKAETNSQRLAKALPGEFEAFWYYVAQQESRGRNPVAKSDIVALAESYNSVLRQVQLRERATRLIYECADRLFQKRLVRDKAFAEYQHAQRQAKLEQDHRRRAESMGDAWPSAREQMEADLYQQRKRFLDFQQRLNELNPGTQWIVLPR